MSSNKVYPELGVAMKEEGIRFKNVAQDVYLCVKTDPDTDKYKIATKTLRMNADSEVDFNLYSYVTAQAGQTKMVLPVHQVTKVCFSMTDDKKLQISGLHNTDPIETPEGFTVADERFFYIKTLENGDIALEATNGIDTNHYLAVDNNNTPTIIEHTDERLSDNLRFSMEKHYNIIPLDN